MPGLCLRHRWPFKTQCDCLAQRTGTYMATPTRPAPAAVVTVRQERVVWLFLCDWLCDLLCSRIASFQMSRVLHMR